MLSTTTTKITEMAKRRITPIFRLNLSKSTKLESIYNHPQIRSLVFDELVLAIKDGIIKSRASVALYQAGDSEYIIELERNEWKTSLRKALDYYCELEDYTKCFEISTMIEKI